MLKIDRKSDVLTLLAAIWDRVMESRFKRFCEAQVQIQQGRDWTPQCGLLMKQSRACAGGLRVKMSDESTAKVITPENWVFDVQVNWETCKTQCSCKRPQQTELPCGHVVAMLLGRKKTLTDFIPWAWNSYNWMAQHSTPLHVIRVDNLFVDALHPCYPPYTRVPRGRPRTQRLRAGNVRGPRGLAFEDGESSEMSEEFQNVMAVNRGRPHCSTCGEMGHNAATCRRPHR